MMRMRFLTVAAVALATTFVNIGVRAQNTVKIAELLELSGAGASVGNNWKNGAELAMNEINAKGGILGHKIEFNIFDTQTSASVARAQLLKALEDKPYVVLGPIFSGSTIVIMSLTQQAEIPELVGSAAPAITQKGNPYVFRMIYSAKDSIPMLTNYIADVLKAKRVGIIWANNDFGKGGHTAFLAAMQSHNLPLALDMSIEQGQLDFTADVEKAKAANLDAVFVYVNEEEGARILNTAKQLGLKSQLLGTTLISDKVIQLAGASANGVQGLLELSWRAPLPEFEAFGKKYIAKYKESPDHNAAEGYIATYVVKYVTEKMGKFDSKEFAKTLHGLTITPKEEPGVLMDTTWLDNGDPNRGAFIAEIVDGKQVIKTVLKKFDR